PQTNPTPPDESDTTGQVFLQIRMNPTSPDKSDHLQPPHNPSVVGSIPTGPTTDVRQPYDSHQCDCAERYRGVAITCYGQLGRRQEHPHESSCSRASLKACAAVSSSLVVWAA